MSRPKVSVIIPVYNAGSYLGECISSVLESTLQEVEVLLVDDGSTDDSFIICKEWEEKDTRIQVFHKHNGGLSDARNYGIDRAKGEFIAFVDSDDKIDTSMLEEMYTACLKYNCKISMCDIILWRPGDKKKTEVRVNDLPSTDEVVVVDMNYADYTGMYHNTAWRKLYHHSLFLTGVKFPHGLYNEDIGFWWIVMAQIDRLVIINKPLYYYRQNNTKSICSTLEGRKRANDTILSFAYGLKYGQRLISPERTREYMDAFLRAYVKTAYPVDISHKAMHVHRRTMKKLFFTAQNSDRVTRDMFFSKFCVEPEGTLLKLCLFRDLQWLNFGFVLSMFGVKLLRLQFGCSRTTIPKT